MSSKFKINEQGLKKVVDDAVRETAKDTQQMFDSVSRTGKGKPVPQVKSRLRSEAKRKGIKFSDAELTDYAKLISDGTKIQVRPGKS